MMYNFTVYAIAILFILSFVDYFLLLFRYNRSKNIFLPNILLQILSKLKKKYIASVFLFVALFIASDFCMRLQNGISLSDILAVYIGFSIFAIIGFWSFGYCALYPIAFFELEYTRVSNRDADNLPRDII